ncbi:hypothetical protein HXA35_15515 [Bacillus sp. A301a_S52]|nr:hypothetical protein [Bacillus sp. A301a_S52]
MEIISFEGLEELLTRLEQIERELETVKDEALIAGGDKLKEAIQSEVYSHGLQRRSGEAQKAIVRTDPKNGELFVGTQGGARRPGFYLYMHEFGYYNVRAGRFISPKPLVSIVFERMRTQILEAEAAVIKRRLGL